MARGYVSTGTYIGIKDGTVYVLGGEFGNTPVSIGTVANTLAQLTGGTPDVEEPVVEVPEGDFDLTISGTVSIFGISTPFSASIEDIPAPGESELNNLEDYVKDELEKQSPDTIYTSFQVSEVSVSSNRVSFRAQYSATISGVTSAYNVVYEYIRN